MATLKQKIEAERTAREMVAREDLPEPDRVEYGFTCIRLFWNEPKIVLVVDIDQLDPEAEGEDEDEFDEESHDQEFEDLDDAA
jgi:hypothetical protein